MPLSLLGVRPLIDRLIDWWVGKETMNELNWTELCWTANLSIKQWMECCQQYVYIAVLRLSRFCLFWFSCHDLGLFCTLFSFAIMAFFNFIANITNPMYRNLDGAMIAEFAMVACRSSDIQAAIDGVKTPTIEELKEVSVRNSHWIFLHRLKCAFFAVFLADKAFFSAVWARSPSEAMFKLVQLLETDAHFLQVRPPLLSLCMR